MVLNGCLLQLPQKTLLIELPSQKFLFLKSLKFLVQAYYTSGVVYHWKFTFIREHNSHSVCIVNFQYRQQIFTCKAAAIKCTHTQLLSFPWSVETKAKLNYFDQYQYYLSMICWAVNIYMYIIKYLTQCTTALFMLTHHYQSPIIEGSFGILYHWLYCILKELIYRRFRSRYVD